MPDFLMNLTKDGKPAGEQIIYIAGFSEDKAEIFSALIDFDLAKLANEVQRTYDFSSVSCIVIRNSKREPSPAVQKDRLIPSLQEERRIGDHLLSTLYPEANIE